MYGALPAFLSTLSLRRATARPRCHPVGRYDFLSTLSLRRATVTVLGIQHRVGFSIHALLAESDGRLGFLSFHNSIFLSTLSLRRATPGKVKVVEPGFAFLSTLSLRRATLATWKPDYICRIFYPRSPCGERLPAVPSPILRMFFLSTLSLRRATW